MSEISLQDRAEGVAVGAAVGDLLGCPIEGFDLSTPISEQYDYAEFDPTDPANTWKVGVNEMVGHIQNNGGTVTEYIGHMGTGFWRYGETTDDTSQWVAAAESMVRRGEFDPADIASRLVKWFDGGYGRGLGGTTLLALSLQDPGETDSPLPWNEAGYAAIAMGPTLVKLRRYEKGYVNTALPANGAVMRTSPLGLFTPLREDYDKLQAAAKDMAIITHAFDETIGTAQIVSELVARMTNGESKQTAVDAVADRYPEHFHKAMDSIESDNGHCGGTYETTGIAIDALMRAGTFREAVELAINATVYYKPWANDVDTIGAVAGGLAGANWGFEAIPKSWWRPTNPNNNLGYDMLPYPAWRLRELGRQLVEAPSQS